MISFVSGTLLALLAQSPSKSVTSAFPLPPPPRPSIVSSTNQTKLLAGAVTVSFLNSNRLATVQVSTNLTNWKTIASITTNPITLPVTNLFFFVNVGFAGPYGKITIEWSPSPSPVSGYMLWWGTASRVYTNYVNVHMALSATLTNMESGTTYYFAAVSYSAEGLRSDFSPELKYTTPSVWAIPRKISTP